MVITYHSPLFVVRWNWLSLSMCIQGLDCIPWFQGWTAPHHHSIFERGVSNFYRDNISAFYYVALMILIQYRQHESCNLQHPTCRCRVENIHTSTPSISSRRVAYLKFQAKLSHEQLQAIGMSYFHIFEAPWHEGFTPRPRTADKKALSGTSLEGITLSLLLY